jgi:hypothetical protein
MAGYKAYCQELYDNGVLYFRPTDPSRIDDGWFERTKPLYDQKEQGLIEGQSPSIHYWAVDGERFIGEFQLRTQFTDSRTGIEPNCPRAMHLCVFRRAFTRKTERKIDKIFGEIL